MTVSSYTSRSPDPLKDKEFGKIIRPATVSGKPAANLPRSLEPTPVGGGHGTRKRELSISGRQLFVAYLVAFCLAGTLVWSFVRYRLVAP